MIKSISSLQFNVKNKISNKDKNLMKNIFIGGIIISATIISFSIKNNYELSKSIDVVQNHYSSIKDYNNFKNSFDNVSYTEDMFKSDLMIFKKLYVNNPSYNIASKDYSLPLSEFMMVKLYTENDQNKVNDYVNNFRDIKITNDNYINVRNKKLNYLRKYQGNNYFLMQELKYNSDATFPHYLSNNFESYLRDKNITKNLFYYSPSSRDYMNKYYRDSNKMDFFLNKKNNDFYELINQVKSGDYKTLKKVFKVLNAYNIEIGKYNINKANYNATFYSLDGKTFSYIENIRNLYTKNGSLADPEEIKNGSKEEERYMSIW